MLIIIEETGEVEALHLLNPETARDCTLDYLRNHGAIDSGEFRYVIERDAFLASRATFEKWQEQIAALSGFDALLVESRKLYGSKAVSAALLDALDYSIDGFTASLNQIARH